MNQQQFPQHQQFPQYPQPQAPAPQQFQQPPQQQVPQQPPMMGGPQQSQRSIFQQMLADPNSLRGGFNSQYIRAGNYLCRIDKCKFGQKRSGVQFWVAEMTVVKVINDNGGQGHKQGEAVTWYIDRTSLYVGRDLRFFAANIMGVAPEMITDENLDMIFNENPQLYGGRVQPFLGLTAEVNAVLIPKKNGDGVFTKVSFKREVPATELVKLLTPQEQEFYYPGGALLRMAQIEAQQSQQAQAAAQQQPGQPPATAQAPVPQPQQQFQQPQGYPQQQYAPQPTAAQPPFAGQR